MKKKPIRALNRARREQIEGQNRRNTIEMPKSHSGCGNCNIFLLFKFYVKSNFEPLLKNKMAEIALLESPKIDFT